MNKNIIVLTYKKTFTTSGRLDEIQLKVNSVELHLCVDHLLRLLTKFLSTFLPIGGGVGVWSDFVLLMIPFTTLIFYCHRQGQRSHDFAYTSASTPTSTLQLSLSLRLRLQLRLRLRFQLQLRFRLRLRLQLPLQTSRPTRPLLRL